MAEVKIDASDTFEGSALDMIRNSGVPESNMQQEPTEQDQPADNIIENNPQQEEPVKQDPQSPSWNLSDIFGEDIDVETAKQRYQEMQSKASQSEQMFANDYMKGLNDYVKSGGTREVYDNIVNVDISKLDGVDAIKTMIMWENPGLAEEDVRLALLDKYRQLDDDSDHDKRVGKVQLLLDEKDARKKLAEIQDSHKSVGPERDQKMFEMQEAKRIDAWTPHTQNMVKGLNSLDVDLGGGSKFTFNEFTEQDKTELMSEMMNIVKYSGLNTTQEDMKTMQAVLRERAIIKKFDKIVNAIYNEAASTSAKAARNEYHNSEVIRKGDTLPNKGSVTPEDNLFERQMAYLTGKRK